MPCQGPAYNLATPNSHNYQLLFLPFFLFQKMLFGLAVAFCFVLLVSSLPQDMDKVHELQRRQLANVITHCTVPNTVALTFVSYWIYFLLMKPDTDQWVRMMVPTILCSWIRTTVFLFLLNDACISVMPSTGSFGTTAVSGLSSSVRRI